MGIKTATGDFNYSDLFFGHKLSDLIDMTHKELRRELHWKSNQLKPGTFGFDSIACSIGFLLSSKPLPTNIEHGAEIVHDAWVRNYLFWSEIKPHVLLPEYYSHSSKSLVDKRRKMLASTSYFALPENEKETNRIIVKTLFDYLQINYNKPKLNEDTFLD
jgi:hypothetical protein